MNDYAVERRHRHRSLLVVEGEHEKSTLFGIIFKSFPELHIDMNDVWVYGTNIYMLYEDIVKEYGDDWSDVDIDIPFVISKKLYPENPVYKTDFINIFLVFDYERHAPQFSFDKIVCMQKYFCDSADVGKLYLNYPMLESYRHITKFGDEEYLERKVPTTLQPGSKYKDKVNLESGFGNIIDFPHRLDDFLKGKKCQVEDKEKREECCEKILSCSSSNLGCVLESTLHVMNNEKEERNVKEQVEGWMTNLAYMKENITYWEYMRKIFRMIVVLNIQKGIFIQNDDYLKMKLKIQYEHIDFQKILNIQNRVSEDPERGFIWVLNTCVFLVPDYNFHLLLETANGQNTTRRK